MRQESEVRAVDSGEISDGNSKDKIGMVYSVEYIDIL